MFTSTLFASILPEILILIIGMLLLIVEPFWKEEQRRNVGWLTAGGSVASDGDQPALWAAWRADHHTWRNGPLRLAGILLQDALHVRRRRDSASDDG